MEKSNKMIIAVGLIVVVAIVGLLAYSQNAPGKYDGFAQCLKDKGAVFYGAFWCPHCQKQKAMFGNSKKYLPYVECSTPDGKGRLEVCVDKEITGYPTWIFADESRETGEVSFATLSSKTSSLLP